MLFLLNLTKTIKEIKSCFQKIFKNNKPKYHLE